MSPPLPPAAETWTSVRGAVMVAIHHRKPEEEAICNQTKVATGIAFDDEFRLHEVEFSVHVAEAEKVFLEAEVPRPIGILTTRLGKITSIASTTP